MSKKLNLILLLLLVSNIVYAQFKCNLKLENSKLTGACDHKLFTGIEIDLKHNLTQINKKRLFSTLPTKGFLVIKNKVKIDIELIETKRLGFSQVMLKPVNQPKIGWLTFDNLEITNNLTSFSLDLNPKVPLTKVDLKIFKQAQKILQKEAFWNKKDDRKCEDDITNNKYSFFCALQKASVDIEKAYNHRNGAMQLIRNLIQERYPKRKWEHRFKDFNNMEETKFNDIVSILEQAIKITEEKLQ